MHANARHDGDAEGRSSDRTRSASRKHTTTGLLYEHSIPAVIGFSIVVQLTSVPLFIAAERLRRREGRSE
jgi:hypothetical protein